jgi:adenylate cyclase
LAELKRRNVHRVAIAYVAVSWLLIQVAETVFPVYGLSDAAIRFVITAAAIGFIPALVISWVFELTPAGLKKDAEVDRLDARALSSVKKFDRVILVLLSLALVYFAFDKFVLDPARDAEMAQEVAKEVAKEVRSEALVESYGDKSIAVLPFVNMSSDPEQAYFSDGIAEEMLNLLAKIPQLRVISRSSAFEFRGDGLNIPEVAKKLNVAHILEGSVRKSGNLVRITVQLIEAVSDTHLWSETYDRSLDDIFAIQDEVAMEVVKQLRVNLLGDIPKAKPVNVLAYPLYLQARQIVGLLQIDQLAIAEGLLVRALEIDPTYVDALMALATVYWYQANWGNESPESRAELEMLYHETRTKAVVLDPDNLSLHIFTGWDKLFESDFVAASSSVEAALNADPSSFDALRLAAVVASKIGQPELARKILEYLVERHPLELWVHFDVGVIYLNMGLFEEALRHYETAASLSPDTGSVNWRLGLARLVAGDPAGAIEDFERETEKVYALQGMVMALHDLGREQESALVLQELVDLENENYAEILAEQSEYVPWPFGFARLHAWIGNVDEAFRYLRITTEQEGPPDDVATNPLFRNFHDDPRWLPFLREIGHAPEQLAEIKFNPRLPAEIRGGN